MGLFLVVAGGSINLTTQTNLVEVLDVQQGIVWSLPNLTIGQPFSCSMVCLSDRLLVLGGSSLEESVELESLALTVYQNHEHCYKVLKFLFEIEFLGRPTQKESNVCRY